MKEEIFHVYVWAHCNSIKYTPTTISITIFNNMSPMRLESEIRTLYHRRNTTKFLLLF